MAGLQYYFFPTDFYCPRPQKINGDNKKIISTDDVAVTEAVHGSVLENSVNGVALNRRDLLLQDKILKVAAPLPMNLVRYKPVLASKNEGSWKWTSY
ncbi:unnamed protein product [Withania somnifera]